MSRALESAYDTVGFRAAPGIGRMFLAAPDEASADTLPEATAKELQLIEVTLS